MEHDITREQAEACLKIIVEECGYRVHDRYDQFVDSIRTDNKDDRWHICREYRFCGALGFGGKFRNNGNNGGIPHVDCYRENETSERLAMIERANQRLRLLFAPTSSTGEKPDG